MKDSLLKGTTWPSGMMPALVVLVLSITSTGRADSVPQTAVLAPEDAFRAPDHQDGPSIPSTAWAFAEPSADENLAAGQKPAAMPEFDSAALETVLSPREMMPTLRTVLLVGLISLLPALLVMTTCFARFAIVFGLLRQGLGAQQWLPNQIIFALSLFLTLIVMSPVWTRSYEEGLQPFLESDFESPSARRLALETAIADSARPLRQFMSTQIAATGNEAAIDMLMSYQLDSVAQASPPQYYEDVPLHVLLPAYLLSELKTAFIIGIQIVIPFLIIDLVVASVLTGMSLMMLPPALVSLPFKLLLFVLVDGWTLTVEMLLASVAQ